MRIGIFTDTYKPQVNGVVSSINTLERELRELGHKVYIITTTDPEVLTVEPNVLRIPSMEFKPAPQYRLGLVYSIKLIKQIEKLNLDIMHSQTEFGVGTFARFASKQLRIPLVHTYHTLYEYYTHYIFKGHLVNQGKKIAEVISKFYCEKCDALIVPTRKVEDILYSYGVEKQMNVIPTGLDISKFYRTCYTDEERKLIREKFGIKQDDFLCVYVGRVAQEKSIDVIIDMFAKINDPKCKLMIVGRSYGDVGEQLKDQAKKLNIEDRVIFVGEVSHNNVPIYYQVGDVFLNASISETQGLTFVEAMAAEIPVCARYDENLKDLLVDNNAGLVYKNDEEFKNNILILKNDQEFRKIIVKNAFDVSQDYTAKKFGERVEELYKKTIEEYNYDESFTLFRGEKYIRQVWRWASSKSSKRSPWFK